MRKGIRIRLAPFKSRSVPVEMWVYVQKNLWYWKFQEFGTAHNAAQPFMRPAFNAHKEKAVEAVRVYLAARIEKEVANL
jgi:HK97 gp10 family phage protein